jgi:integrase
MKLKLDAKTVSTLTLPTGTTDAVFWDDALDRFGLRLRQRPGARMVRSWIVQYRHDGSSRRMTLGSPDVLTPDQARTLARKTLAQVTLGDNPQGDRAERRDKNKLVFRDVVADYLDARRPHLAKSSYAHNVSYLTGSDYFKALHAMPLDRITRKDVAAQLLAIERRRGQIVAAGARSKLSAFFVWAMRMGLAEANPLIGTIQYKAAPARERVLDDAELMAIWNAADPAEDLGRILRLLILLPCRRGEVSGMAWSELDLDADTWTIPAARCKNKRSITLPLLPMAKAIIRSVPRRASRDRLFGERAAGGFDGWANGKPRIDAKLPALRPWTVHDIRRSVATGMADSGIAPHVIEQCLNHQSGHRAGVAGIYNRSTYDREVRSALAVWEDRICRLTTGAEPKVVSFSPKRQKRSGASLPR